MRQFFASERIRFVEVSEALIPDYLAMVNDYENVGRWIGMRQKTVTAESETAWVRGKLEEKAAVFSMLEKASGAYIGNIELMDVQDGAAELGIAITASQQEKGYGTEAIRSLTEYGFERLGLRRIYLKVYPDNARAIHAYEKSGFREYARTDEDVYMEIRLAFAEENGI